MLVFCPSIIVSGRSTLFRLTKGGGSSVITLNVPNEISLALSYYAKALILWVAPISTPNGRTR